MAGFATSYVAALISFVAIDFVWLGFVARQFYVSQLGTLMRDQPNFSVAGLFYLLYPVGLVVLAVQPALRQGSGLSAVGLGALFGLVAYATYDLSNLATLRGWPVSVVVVDILWGAIVSAVVAYIAFALTRLLLG